jgi:hypothetical protein
MKTTRSRLFYIVFGFTLGHLLIGATPVAAQGDCRLVFDATSKVFSTPAHIYVTTNIGGKPQIVEEICRFSKPRDPSRLNFSKPFPPRD